MQKLAQIIKSNQFETVFILKELNIANRYLGELKGLCQSIPNQSILVNTLTLQEAQDSSEIENIITTQDEIFKFRLQPRYKNIAAKEVNNYGIALNDFAQKLNKNNLITINMIIAAQKIIKGNEAGIRKQKGTALISETDGKIIYTPPHPNELQPLLNDLEKFINASNDVDIDPLIKMAIIHHQFESIRPFYDGNGRIGRIINIIYLVQQGLLNTPILYLSRYINHNKQKYYYFLQEVRDTNRWQDWVIFMLRAVNKTAQQSIILINEIKKLQQKYKNIIRSQYSAIYSQDLLNNIFKNPYTKIQFLQDDLEVSRLTASRYLDKLTQGNLLIKHKLGRENYYLNYKLINILSKIENMHDKNL